MRRRDDLPEDWEADKDDLDVQNTSSIMGSFLPYVCLTLLLLQLRPLQPTDGVNMRKPTPLKILHKS